MGRSAAKQRESVKRTQPLGHYLGCSNSSVRGVLVNFVDCNLPIVEQNAVAASQMQNPAQPGPPRSPELPGQDSLARFGSPTLACHEHPARFSRFRCSVLYQQPVLLPLRRTKCQSVAASISRASFSARLDYQKFECIPKTKKSLNAFPPQLLPNITFVLTLLSTGR